MSIFFSTACTSWFHHVPMPSKEEINSQAHIVARQANGLDPKVARLALTAYHKAQARGVAQPTKLAIIDYSKPSTERRFWAFDMRTHKLLYSELVAHGKNSGEKFATKFSDQNNSLQTSIGLYKTASNHYMGRHGYSLRLVGLDNGFNGNAMRRAIVMHGAPYVSETFAKQQGRLGLSWGCPALGMEVHREVINELKGGNLIFAYYPDERWLRQSRYLNA
ncbi:MAG: murein L,D-transpeptidase catalytic domain family protein [Gammaproteobacteria bacterium]